MRERSASQAGCAADLGFISDAEQSSGLGDIDAEMVATADGTKAKAKPASNTAHDHTASKPCFYQAGCGRCGPCSQSSTLKRLERTAAWWPTAATPRRLRAHSGACQGLMRGIEAFGEAIPIVAAVDPDNLRGENTQSASFDSREGSGQRLK
jgi:hypothetical protein